MTLHNFGLIIIILFSMNICCVTPTFESPSVHKGVQGWIGGSGGYYCFEYNVPDIYSLDFGPVPEEYTFEDTKGIAAGGGLVYGFTENIGLTSNFLFYRVDGYKDGSLFQTKYLLSAHLASKFEITRNKSNSVVSLAIGPSYPDVVRIMLMMGLKKGSTMFTLGTHNSYLIFFRPYHLFLNIGPSGNSGAVIYVGYQLPWMYDNPFNFAVGLGYRFR